MLHHLNHLIKPNQSIDYYVIKYPRMVRAYYQCLNGYAPRMLLYSENLKEHIQLVIKEHNDDLVRMQRNRNYP